MMVETEPSPPAGQFMNLRSPGPRPAVKAKPQISKDVILALIAIPALSFLTLHGLVTYKPTSAGFFLNYAFNFGYLPFCVLEFYVIMTLWFNNMLPLNYTTPEIARGFLPGLIPGVLVNVACGTFLMHPMVAGPFAMVTPCVMVWVWATYRRVRPQFAAQPELRRRLLMTLLYLGAFMSLLSLSILFFALFRVVGGVVQSVCVVLYSLCATGLRKAMAKLSVAATGGSERFSQQSDFTCLAFVACYKVFILTEVRDWRVFAVSLLLEVATAANEALSLTACYQRLVQRMTTGLRVFTSCFSALCGGENNRKVATAPAPAAPAAAAPAAPAAAPAAAAGAGQQQQPQQQQQEEGEGGTGSRRNSDSSVTDSDSADPSRMEAAFSPRQQLAAGADPAVARRLQLRKAVSALFTKRFVEATVPLYYLISLPVIYAGPNASYYIISSGLTQAVVRRAALYAAITLGAELLCFAVLACWVSRRYSVDMVGRGLQRLHDHWAVYALEYSFALLAVTKYMLWHCNLDLFQLRLGPSDFATWTAAVASP